MTAKFTINAETIIASSKEHAELYRTHGNEWIQELVIAMTGLDEGAIPVRWVNAISRIKETRTLITYDLVETLFRHYLLPLEVIQEEPTIEHMVKLFCIGELGWNHEGYTILKTGLEELEADTYDIKYEHVGEETTVTVSTNYFHKDVVVKFKTK